MSQQNWRAYAIIMQHIGFLKGVSASGDDVSAEEVSNTAYAIEEQVDKLFKGEPCEGPIPGY